MIVQFQIANVGQYFVRTDWLGLMINGVNRLSNNGRLEEVRQAAVIWANYLKHVECAGRG